MSRQQKESHMATYGLTYYKNLCNMRHALAGSSAARDLERAEALERHMSNSLSELSEEEQHQATLHDAYLTGYYEGKRGVPMAWS